jgi:hypothetical protein
MVAKNDDPPLESRPPVLEDLVGLCSQLNSHGARYVVVGGMAVIQAGFVRATEDIDLLIAGDEDNVGLVREALMTLPDGAARDLGLDDPKRYTVVRVADEIVVDLLTHACGIGYDEASASVEIVEIDGVAIPFATPDLLLKMKQTVREKDRLDRMFLEQLLASRESS